MIISFISSWKKMSLCQKKIFIRFEFSLITFYKKKIVYTFVRNKVFFSNILIPTCFQPDGLNFVYFNINGLRHRVAKIYKMKIRVFGINSFSLNLKWKPLVFAVILFSRISYISILQTFCNVLMGRIIVTLLELKLSPHSLTFYEQQFY